MLPGDYSQEHVFRASLETVGLDETDFACLDQGLRPIVDPKLPQNMFDVTLDCIWRDDERVSDFLIRCTTSNQGENLPFTGTQWHHAGLSRSLRMGWGRGGKLWLSPGTEDRTDCRRCSQVFWKVCEETVWCHARIEKKTQIPFTLGEW